MWDLRSVIIIKNTNKILVKLAQVVPNGMLICFPSRRLMNQCIRIWNAQNILIELNNVKEIFIEVTTLYYATNDFKASKVQRVN